MSQESQETTPEENPPIPWETLVERDIPDGHLTPVEVRATATIARSIMVVSQVATGDINDPASQLILGYRSLLLNRLHQKKLVRGLDQALQAQFQPSPPQGNSPG